MITRNQLGFTSGNRTKKPFFFFVTGDRITRLVQEKTSPRLNVILMLTFKRISCYIFMNNMQHVGSLTVVQFLGWFARRLLAGCTNRSKRADASEGSKCAESVSGAAGSGEEGASPWGRGLGQEARWPGAGIPGGKARGAPETRGWVERERSSLLEGSKVKRRLVVPSSAHRHVSRASVFSALYFFPLCNVALVLCVPPHPPHHPWQCPPGEVSTSLRTKTPAVGLSSLLR